MDYSNLSARQLGRMIADRKISAREAAISCLNRIDAAEPDLLAFITVTSDQALMQADETDSRLQAGEKLMPLAGVPMALKDNISTAGIRTTCASRMLEGYVPPYTATAADRLLKGGAVMLGKTNMDEFAMGSTTETSYMQVTRNPWQPQHVPGGSSGGSAAGVAAGEVFYALGSDTGGSIRQPCSYCGLTGLKPTYGSVSRYGLIAYASSLDQIGPIARDAADCALVFNQIAGTDDRDSTSMKKTDNKKYQRLNDLAERIAKGDDNPTEGLAGKRVAIPQSFLSHQLQPEVKLSMDNLISRLTELGAECVSCEMPLLDESIPAYYLIATAEASANLARYDGVQYGYRSASGEFEDLIDFYSKNRSEGFGREVRQRIMLGTFALSSGYYDAYYLQAQKTRNSIRNQYMALLANHDFILSPTAPTTAPMIGTSLNDPLNMYLSDIFTVAANLTGLPALAMPCGFDDKGLPIGFQLTGRAFAEAELFEAGLVYQSSTDFHLRQPRLNKREEAQK